ncbi:helix-turn-helix domain-containing protein [Paenibacillus sp. TAF43_2]|uniref:helix-turn-helix domain-containing protein n=1 Tax=Paenibacillus sp. TAF43_2 TaxID=3233069 RepID=UPI003F9A9819
MESKIEDLPDILEVDDIRSYLGISKTAAYNLVKSGEFHVVKVGRIFRIPKKSFQTWLQGND